MDIHFGLKIKELMMINGLSQNQAASLMEMSGPGLSKVIDKEDLSTSLLKKACEVFNVDMSYFLLTNNNNTIQKGNANIGKSGSIQYKGSNNVMGSDHRIQVLESENEHLKKQIELLEQMVSILKEKKT